VTNQTFYMSLFPQEIKCSDWVDLHNAIEALGGADPYQWLFRGHVEASWGLIPLIERECELRRLLPTELRLYDEFRSKAHLYTTQVPPVEDVVGWLSTMQHHGVPTRLLDWSYSAYVALFFACERAGEEESAALWAIHTERLSTKSHELAADMFGIPLDAVFESPERFNRIAFPHAFEGTSTGLVIPILPRFRASRLSSQQGCFLLNCNYLATFEESVAAMMKDVSSDWLYRIVFPSSLRIECLKRLMHFNIHPASLYPDLEGLAKFLTLKNTLFPV